MNPERRAQPRYVVSFPVQMRVVDDEQVFAGVALNVSRNALEVDCDTVAVKSLQARSRFPYCCEIEFRLPGLQDDARIACQLLKSRRLSQHRYRIVLGFRDAMALPQMDHSAL